MPLTVLGDDDVRTLLHSLTKHDILSMQQSLADALHYYSTAVDDDDNGCCATFQPKRSALQRKNGSTTLFMPAMSNDGIGVKIVTLKEATPSYPSTESSSIDLSSRSSVSTISSGTPSLASLSITDSSKSTQSTKSSSSKTAYPQTDSSTTAFDVPDDSSPAENDIKKGVTTSPTGSLTLLDKNGTPRALVNAAEVTAFRTALATTCLFKKRANVHDLVVFGAGKQAYWHIRLALLLRGDEIHHLNIINRSFDTAVRLIESLFKTNWPVPVAHPQTSILTPRHAEYDRLLKSTLRSAAAVFCTTPSTQPLFPAEILTSTEGRRKGRYIAAIGSYKPYMVEIHPDIVRQAVAPQHHHHHHKHAKQGGAIVVDSVEACLREAGEVIQAGLGGRDVVELGELIMLKRDAERRRLEKEEGLDVEGVEIGEQRARKKGVGSRKEGGDKADDGLREWLEKGNVVYKSVGLGLMDVVVGGEIVRLADERGFGVRIENF
jgi:ornithine cyclodeaminase/alanine dehydrogenase-like protein (mu-crystallin family)